MDPEPLRTHLVHVCDIVETRVQRFTGRLKAILQEQEKLAKDDHEILHIATESCVSIATCIKDNLDQLNQACQRILYTPPSSSSSLPSSSPIKRTHDLLSSSSSSSSPPPKRSKSVIVVVDEEEEERDKGKAEEEEVNSTTNDGVLHIWTDGACKGNGRADAVAGIGVYFGHRDKRNVAERYLPSSGLPATNQTAELSAAIRALEIGLAQPGANSIQIHTDSMYTIDCVNKWIHSWKRKNWLTAKGQPVKNQPLIKRLYELAFEQTWAKVSFVHVRGHSGDANNDCADKLANEGCTKPK